MTLREAAFMWFYIMLGSGTIYWIYDRLKSNSYDAGYWCGRSAGWRAANEHYEKIRKLKSQSVFDYDKN
jgi:hypothetical protein